MIFEEVFCTSCFEMIKDVARVLKIPAGALGTEIEHDEPVECDNCNAELPHGELTVLISNEILEMLADMLSKDIGGCQNCESHERWALIHAFNNDPFDTTSRMDESLADGMCVSDYLQESGVPYELVDKFSKLIVCSCGYGRDSQDKHNPDGGGFDPDDEVYTRRDIEDFWGFDVPDFLEFTQQYDIELTMKDFISFREHLSRHPMLGSEHETGKKILEALKKHFEQNNYVTLHASTRLFRSRTRKRDSRKSYTTDEMWSPPTGLPQHGRFNSVGVSVLYVTNNINGLPFEVHPAPDELLDVAEFELMKDLKLFDIGEFNSEFAGFFNEVNEESKPLKRAYLIPNFIGSCCSFIGYDGVKYNGVHLLAGNYTNYALFNVEREHLQVVKPTDSYDPGISYGLRKM